MGLIPSDVVAASTVSSMTVGRLIRLQLGVVGLRWRPSQCFVISIRLTTTMIYFLTMISQTGSCRYAYLLHQRPRTLDYPLVPATTYYRI